MKVLIVNSYSRKGGAAKAAYRLFEALKYEGLDVNFKVIHPETPSLHNKIIYMLRALLDRLPGILISRKRNYFSLGMISNKNILKYINSSDADIVHLHWVNAGGMSVADVNSINKPVVWTMHDNWVFTGGCHVMWDCKNYATGCGKCPELGSSIQRDLSTILARRKENLIASSNILFTGVSDWMVKTAKKSVILKDKPVVCLPNPVNTELYNYRCMKLAKERLDISADSTVILFGAGSNLYDVNKGFKLLLESLSHLENDKNYELVVFGSNGSDFELSYELNVNVRFVGYINDEEKLNLLYSAASVMVVPSLQESFGQTAAEAMACYTPVVAFNTSGLVDIVDHGVNGYLAEPYDVLSFAEGISWIINNPHYQKIRSEAREKIVNKFSYTTVANKCIELYGNMT